MGRADSGADVLIYSAGPRASWNHPKCEVVERYRQHGDLAQAESHGFRCGNGSLGPVQSSTVAEFNTMVSGAIVVTTDGTSPLRLQCVQEGQLKCDMQVAFD